MVIGSAQLARLRAAPRVTEATPKPRFVKITQSASVGTTVLPAGTRVEFVSQEGSDFHIRYKGGEYAIPISATDLK